jgi:hypothetical protein
MDVGFRADRKPLLKEHIAQTDARSEFFWDGVEGFDGEGV